MEVPFLDLKAQYRGIRDEVREAIDGVLESCQFTLGQEVADFEEEFAAYCTVDHAVAVNSGTSALHLALLAADIGRGDEVITVPFTFVATVAAIEYAGATPVFVDVDPLTMTMDPQQIEAAITPKTRAIMPVHLHGLMADMTPIMAIAQRHGLTVIEDAAQAHGAEYHGRRAGSIGDFGCFSFYPGKNLGAYGEAGMVVTGDPDMARKLRMLRDWGSEKKYEHTLRGFNYRMEGIQGAVLRVKLRYLEQWTESRRRWARRYNELLDGSGLVLAHEPEHARHVYHIYAIRAAERAHWQSALKDAGIQTGIHYPVPVHLQPAYQDLGYRAGQFPVAERLADEVLSLPMFPELTEPQCRHVAAAVQQIADRPLSRVS